MIVRKKRDKKRLIGLLVNGTVEESDAKPMLVRISGNVQVLEGRLSNLQESMSSSFEFKTFAEFFQVVKDFLMFASAEKNMIDAFVQRVDVRRDHIHITLSLDTPDKTQKKTASEEDACWVKVGVKEGN